MQNKIFRPGWYWRRPAEMAMVIGASKRGRTLRRIAKPRAVDDQIGKTVFDDESDMITGLIASPNYNISFK
ncbi:hypothetical protein [Agrobacterium sp. NPDC089420]|uniref:hypothetical protein n=1 Tax=Agrobacterium sp. NPDC089420 TaxID=3363918 RepID=UPI00384C56C3